MSTETKIPPVFKGELVEGMTAYARAEGVELTKKQADTALNGLIETMKTALADGRRVNFIGFGSLEVRYRPARPSWDMQRKEMVSLPARNYVYFNNGSDLAEKVQGVTFVAENQKNDKTKWVIQGS